MRRLMVGALAIMMALPMIGAPLFADIPINERVSLDGNLRFRGFFDDRDFDTENNDPAFYGTMRTQLGFKIQATDDVLFRLKVKESRYLGVPRLRYPEGGSNVYSPVAKYDASTNNTLSSSYLGMQEGYIFASDVFDSGLDLQLGRFEMEYGRGRLMGASDWGTNGPRTYDGFRVMYHKPDYQIDFFTSIQRDYSFGDVYPYYRMPSGWGAGVYRFDRPSGYNEMKRYLFGMAGSFFDNHLQPIVMFDWDSFDVGFDAQSPGQDTNSKEQEFWFTLGSYGNYMFEDVGNGRIELEGDGAVQMGQVNNQGAYPDSYSLFSFMVAAEGRYHFDRDDKPFIGLGFDITGVGEGDEDPEDVYTFYQFYYTQHDFRGYMDYFWNVNNGLMDVYLTMGWMPKDWLSLTADIHNFNFITSQGRVRPNGSTEDLRLLGQEVDLLAQIRVKEGFYLDAGYSLFAPTEEFGARVNGTAYVPAQTNKSEFGYYAYLAFTTKF